MADAGSTLIFQVQTKQAVENVNTLKAALSSLQKEAATLNAALGVSKTTQSIDKAASSFTQLGAVTKHVDSATSSINHIGKAADKAQNVIVRFNRSLNGVSLGTKELLDGSATNGKKFLNRWNSVLKDASVQEVIRAKEQEVFNQKIQQERLKQAVQSNKQRLKDEKTLANLRAKQARADSKHAFEEMLRLESLKVKQSEASNKQLLKDQERLAKAERLRNRERIKDVFKTKDFLERQEVKRQKRREANRDKNLRFIRADADAQLKILEEVEYRRSQGQSRASLARRFGSQAVVDNTAQNVANLRKASRDSQLAKDEQRLLASREKAMAKSLSREHLASLQDRHRNNLLKEEIQLRKERTRAYLTYEKELERARIKRNQTDKRIADTRVSQATKNARYDLLTPEGKLRKIQEAHEMANRGVRSSLIARTVGSQAFIDSQTPRAIQDLYRALENTNAASNRASEGMRKFGTLSRDTHGFVRGLSGALNQLWMTYGALAPLLTGAAIGSIARSTFNVGKDLEYRLKFVEALGNAPIKVDQIMPAVMGSMKTPLEAAEALQALAQAGFTSKQSLEALQATMQLSTLGELGMTEAAIAMTGTISAFGLSAQEASKVGDVFAKAAASSNTSVEQISQSMRQASTAAAQYGISVEEASAALAVMAKRNITGSMAGTSYRNMLKELYTPIARGAKAMKTLGLSAYDTEGNMKGLTQILQELDLRLAGLTEQSRNETLEAIFGERGGRAIRPILDDLDAYVDMIKEMEGSIGFLEEASAKLLNTTEGRINIFQSTLQQSFAKAFAGVQKDVNAVISELTKLVRSEGFISTIELITRSFASLATTLMDNKTLIRNAIIAWGSLKLTITALSSLQNAANAVSKAGLAIEEQRNRKSIELRENKMLEAAARNRNTASIIAETNAQRSSALADRFPSAKRGLDGGVGKNSSKQTAANVGMLSAATAAVASSAQTASKVLGLVVGAASRLLPVVSLLSLGYMGVSWAMETFGSKTDESTRALENQNAFVEDLIERLKERNRYLSESNTASFLQEEQAQLNQLETLTQLKFEVEAIEEAQKNLGSFIDSNNARYQEAVQIVGTQDEISNRLIDTLAGINTGITANNEKQKFFKETGQQTEEVIHGQNIALEYQDQLNDLRASKANQILAIEQQIAQVMARNEAAALRRASSSVVGGFESLANQARSSSAKAEALRNHGKVEEAKRLEKMAAKESVYRNTTETLNAKYMSFSLALDNAIKSGDTEAASRIKKATEEAQRRDEVLLEEARLYENSLKETVDFGSTKGGGGGSGKGARTPRYKPTQDERSYDRIVRSANDMRLKTDAHLGSAYRQTLEHQSKLLDDVSKKYMSEKDIYVLEYRNRIEDEYNKLIKDRQTKIEELEAVVREGAGGSSDYTKTQVEDAKAQILSLKENINLVESHKVKASALAAQFADNEYTKQSGALSKLREEHSKLQTDMDKTWYTVTDAMISHWDRAVDSLANFVATGEMNIKQFTANTLAELSKMAFKIAANRILHSIIGMVFGSGGGGGGFQGGWGGSSLGSLPINFAKGGAFDGGSRLTRFASGGVFTNSIARRSHVAPMAMFGEAGPEAIMPLTRMPGGDLGIRAIPTGAPDGGASVNNVSVVTNVVVNSDGSVTSETSTGSGDAMYKQLGDMITNQTKAIIVKEIGQGGLIRRAIQER